MRLPTIKGLTTPDGEVRPLKAALHVATHPHHLSVLLALKRGQTIAAEAIRRVCHSMLHTPIAGHRMATGGTQ
jgi:hypothetical protein